MKALLTLACVLAFAQATVLQVSQPMLAGWYSKGAAPADAKVHLTFSLKRDNSLELARLKQASTPGSKYFREWATFEESKALRQAVSGKPVIDWLNAKQIPHTVFDGVITVDTTVAIAEKLLDTTFETYQHVESGVSGHRAGTIFAPVEVTTAVAAVYGVHGLPLPPRKTRKLSSSPNVGPTDIRKAYQVPSSTRGSGNLKVRQAVAEFQGQFANEQDLQQFFQQFVPNAQSGDSQIYAYKGNRADGYGIEAELDIQYIMGNAPGIKTEFWGWQNFDFCSDLKNWTTTILNDQDPPLVHSVSYGWQGDLGQIGCTTAEIHDVDKDFASIANRGISIIFASGDSGSAYDGTKLWPSWPASSPFVTAVGSTRFTDASMSQETSSMQFGSGSGFSAMFPRPSWQNAAVTGYLNKQSSSLPPNSIWSRDGRATADISALGEGYQVYVQGSVMIVGGTSASTPTFASFVSLINDQLIAKGKKPLGYLNPWIYANGDMFKDITVGSDKIDRGGNTIQYGFDDTTGWDPASGFGSPLFDKLLAKALSQ